MNKLSCLEHLSTLSFSTEMSEMLLHRKKTKETQTVTEVWVYKGSIKTLQPFNLPAKTITHLILANLGLFSCLSMRLRRICSTNRRTSGSSVREKDSRGSKKELGSAVSMLVVWKPAVTYERDDQIPHIVYKTEHALEHQGNCSVVIISQVSNNLRDSYAATVSQTILV